MTINNPYKKYSSFSTEDLLQDDYFITSMTKPTRESEAFWRKVLEEDILNHQDYKRACYFIDSVQVKSESISQEEIYQLWENIEVINKSNLKKGKKQLRFFMCAIAGVIALLVTLSVFHNYTKEDIVEEILAFSIEDVKAPDTPVTDIQLILTENETVSLTGKEAEIAYKEDGIAINNQKTDLQKEQTQSTSQTEYNQLIVPLGKRSMLTFAEGSKIWVNSGSRVVYPVAFSDTKREIYVDGEVYLDVVPDKDCPFIVKTRDLSISVLGTSFNIMAYEKDTVRNIVLVNGSVKINSKGKPETLLAPNEMYSYINGSAQVRKVEVTNYITWKQGIYKYDSEPLGAILKRLSRYYGKSIVCSPEVSQLKCSGKLDLKDDLLQVLNGISKTAPVICQQNDGLYQIVHK